MINNKILRNISSIIFSLTIMLSFSNCSDSSSENSKTESVKIDKSNVLKAVINVKGMTCEGCEATIQSNVSKIPGVVSVKASHVDENTIIEYDKSQTNPQEIEKVISETGYQIFQAEEKAQIKEVPQAMKCGAGKCGHAE